MALGIGCAARKAVVIDSGADWVKLGPDVSGHVYVYDSASKDWKLSPNKVTLPEGWVAGPEPK
jgi:hypothetical protein